MLNGVIGETLVSPTSKMLKAMLSITCTRSMMNVKKASSGGRQQLDVLAEKSQISITDVTQTVVSKCLGEQI